MKVLTNYLSELWSATLHGWDRFWFKPSDPATLGMIRILGGLMLLYTHLIWTKDFDAFFGPNDPWLSREAVRAFQTGAPSGVDKTGNARNSQTEIPAAMPTAPMPIANGAEIVVAVPDGATSAEQANGESLGPRTTYAWSWFKWTDSRGALWTLHVFSLVAFACLTLGLFTRAAAVAAFLATVSYVNRVPGALFGLDQVNGMVSMYLALGPSGSAWSLDRWLRARRTGRPLEMTHISGATIAIRLIQIHMCVIYLFAGLGKLQGPSWWNGYAMWQAFASLEYQSLDMTWLADWPRTVNLMTHVTVCWEIFFCVLIWPRLTRPIMLLIAIPLHLGIAICLGMPTFGLAMLIGCAAFLSPPLVRGLARWCASLVPRGSVPPAAAASRG